MIKMKSEALVRTCGHVASIWGLACQRKTYSVALPRSHGNLHIVWPFETNFNLEWKGHATDPSQALVPIAKASYKLKKIDI
jgi:hypothetical protein